MMDLELAFVSDPARVVVGYPAWAFLTVVCLIGPLLAWRSRRALASGPVGAATPAVPRLRVYLSSGLWLAMLAWLAWLAAGKSHIWLFWPPRIGLQELSIGLIGLGLGFCIRPLIVRIAPEGRRQARLLAPRTAREHAGFVALAAAASVGEEIIYRGVLFMVFAALTGSWWGSALLAAVVFGLAHLAYGWRTALVIMLYGVRDQLVVGLTGGLYVAMAVHFAHDLIVGQLASREAAREAVA